MLAAMKRVPWWIFASAAPMGLGAWAPIVPGRRCHRRAWIAWGALWSAVALAGWIAAAANDGGSGAGLLIILGWVGALATTLSIRTSYRQLTASSFLEERAEAEQRLEERREAQRLAAERPELARELGIGRPDDPEAEHAGLVDVNNAGLSALLELPGVDDALATRIVELRAELNGFSSVHELGGLLDLDGHAVERLRDRVVFLPR
jgi:DNA uptake protein ComE-like DNA-binding protein